MAESVRGSSPSVFIRLNVSRHGIPASTRIFVLALATTAQFPRLPLANIETQTPMHRAYAPSLWIGSNFLVSRYLGDDLCGDSRLGCPSQRSPVPPKPTYPIFTCFAASYPSRAA